MRKIECPLAGYEDCFIGLPDEWLGKHVLRRDKAIEQARKDQHNSAIFINLAVSMALLDEWKLPGLTGNPEQWDFEQLNMQIMLWVADVVLTDFGKALIVPKAPSSPLPAG